jgi:shikimate kinase
MTFEDSFEAWLTSSTNTAVPASVRAFSFNLCEFEDNSSPFGVELIGSPDFDMEDNDWACDEAWEATPRMLRIPVAFSSSSWETCLAAMKRLIVAAIDDDGAGQVLKTREGIAVGFIDGDLDVVWHR